MLEEKDMSGINAYREIDQVLARIVLMAGKVTGSDYISVLLVDEAGHILRGDGNLEGMIPIDRRARRKGFTTWILRSHQAVSVDEIKEGGAVWPLVGGGAPKIADPYLVAKGIKSFAGLPLAVEDHIMGVLYLHSLSPGAFHGQMPLLTKFAKEVATVIENARRSDTVRKKLAERKQTKEAQGKNERLFRALFELSPDAVMLIDPHDPKVSWPIVDCNEAACTMNGYRHDELIGQSIDILNVTQGSQDERTAYLEQIRAAGVLKLESRHRHKNGNVFPIEISTSLVKVSEHELVIGIDRDISDRKRAEESLVRQDDELRLRNQELARLYRASGSLISGISLTLQEQAQKIVEIVQQEFGQSNCSLFLVWKDSGEVERLAVAGPYADQVKNKRLTLKGPGLVPHAIRTGKVLNVPDVRATSGYVPNWEAARSELTIPLMVRGDVVGAIDIQSAEPTAFTEEDEHMMTVFGERAALVLDNSRLSAETAVHMRQLTALRTIDIAITSSFEISLTLKILLDQLIELLEVHAADVLAFNETTSTFKVACERGFRLPVSQQTLLNSSMGFAWRVIRERHMVILPDIRKEPTVMQRSFDQSGEQFITYIGIPLIAKGQIKGVLEIFHREALGLGREQIEFLEALARQAAIAMENIELFDHLQSLITSLNIAIDSTLEGWASAVELRDKAKAGHAHRVAELTCRLTRLMGVDGNDQVQVYRGALLHDVGKMNVPDNVMLKPGSLTEDEWGIMQKHPQYAYDLLSKISYLREALDIPYCHHEKWDGTGYPRGLKGNQVPLPARVFAVVDVWDTLTSDRPYRKAWTQEEAKNHLQEQAGKQFDPKVVEIFMKEVLRA
jgi:PAS domain S-box-containing protein